MLYCGSPTPSPVAHRKEEEKDAGSPYFSLSLSHSDSQCPVECRLSLLRLSCGPPLLYCCYSSVPWASCCSCTPLTDSQTHAACTLPLPTLSHTRMSRPHLFAVVVGFTLICRNFMACPSSVLRAYRRCMYLPYSCLSFRQVLLLLLQLSPIA